MAKPTPTSHTGYITKNDSIAIFGKRSFIGIVVPFSPHTIIPKGVAHGEIPTLT